MPPRLTPAIITAALAGFEVQKTRTDDQIAELRAMLSGVAAKTTATPEAPKRKRRKMSAAGQKAIAEAQRKRWAASKAAVVAAPDAAPEAEAFSRRQKSDHRRHQERWAFHVFSGGDGVMFAITDTGDLFYYKYSGVSNGAKAWSTTHVQIGHGWNFRHVFSGGNGVIFAITDAGELFYYKYLGMATGANSWGNTHMQIGNGWNYQRPSEKTRQTRQWPSRTAKNVLLYHIDSE